MSSGYILCCKTSMYNTLSHKSPRSPIIDLYAVCMVFWVMFEIVREPSGGSHTIEDISNLDHGLAASKFSKD